MAQLLMKCQRDAVAKMHNGCVLCGGVGTGKSRTALAYYYIKQGGDISEDGRIELTSTYTCTDSVNSPAQVSKNNAGNICHVHSQRPFQDLYIITTARKRDTLEWDSELVPYLMSQNPEFNAWGNKVIIDSWNNMQKYVGIENSFFIFDEQRLVSDGAWVKAFYKIAKVNSWILLSATPADNWSDYIPIFIANGFYKNKTEFNREHVIYKPYSKFYQIDRYVNIKRLIRLRDKILVNIEYSRKTVSHNEDIWCHYDSTTYKLILKDRWNPFKEKPIENVSELCQCLRQVCNTDISRIVSLLEIFEKHPKAIIFYNYDYELELLKNLTYGPDVEIAEWNGHKHQEVPKSESWVYLVQYNAGCEGWNCITTDTIIFWSQNYSYRIMEQARGRIDRMNTPFIDLYYYHLKSRSGIDLAINRAITNKKKFNESSFMKF